MLMEGIIRWAAVIFGVGAAVIVASNLGRKPTGTGFVLFTVSSLAWIATGYFEDLPSLMIQNVALTVINVIGIYRWLIVNRDPSAAVSATSDRTEDGQDLA